MVNAGRSERELDNHGLLHAGDERLRFAEESQGQHP